MQPEVPDGLLRDGGALIRSHPVAAKIGRTAPFRQLGWAAVVEGSSGWPKQETARTSYPDCAGAQGDCIAKNMRFYDQLVDFVRFAR